MRFITMHKNDPHTEAGVMPPPELMQKMGAFIGEHVAAGRFLGGEGLGGSKTRTRLTFRDGRTTVKHGPYSGENELPAAVLLLKVRSREEAIGWAERYGKILGDGEIELGPVHEPWDMGFGTKPENAPLRILMLEKADQASEAGQRSTKQKADLTRLKTEMTKAGVLASAELIEPSSKGKRLVRHGSGEIRVVDGPFSESKELIGGFAILKLDTIEDAIRECTRYSDIFSMPEVDILPLVDE